VLIPRPETELLLERALGYVEAHPRAVVADVGTGSGALAVTLAANCPEATVYAIDISEAALDVARRNAETHGVTERVTFLHGDLLAPILVRGIKLDVVMANLPYIASDEVPRLDVSRYEPTLALDGGADGLILVRRLLAQLPQASTPGALALLEIGADQGAASLALVGDTAHIVKDYAGLDRILVLTMGERL
jgi:release factor glutamine methyltransferase